MRHWVCVMLIMLLAILLANLSAVLLAEGLLLSILLKRCTLATVLHLLGCHLLLGHLLELEAAIEQNRRLLILHICCTN